MRVSFSEDEITTVIENSFVNKVYKIGYDEGYDKGFEWGRSIVSYWWIALSWFGWVLFILFLALVISKDYWAS